MRLNDGLAEWSNELKNIYVTREVRGLEWLFDLTIWALQIATLSQIVQICVWGRRYQVPTWFTEAYVCAVTIILCFLWWSDDVTRVSAVVVGYLLGTTIIVLFNVVFLSKLSFIGPVASHERTLLLFMLNIAQV